MAAYGFRAAPILIDYAINTTANYVAGQKKPALSWFLISIDFIS